eukprot:5284661-Prymnesium_polylepis.1
MTTSKEAACMQAVFRLLAREGGVVEAARAGMHAVGVGGARAPRSVSSAWPQFARRGARGATCRSPGW